MFNSTRNNQRKLVIFIVKKHRVLLQIPKSDKQFILAYVPSVHHQLSHNPKSFQEAQYGFVQQDGSPAHMAMLAED